MKYGLKNTQIISTIKEKFLCRTLIKLIDWKIFSVVNVEKLEVLCRVDYY